MIIKQILLVIIVTAHCICIMGLTSSSELIQTQQDDYKKIEDAINLIHYHMDGEWKEISLDIDKRIKRLLLEESKEQVEKVLSISSSPYSIEKEHNAVVARHYFLGELYFPDKLITTVQRDHINPQITIIESLSWLIIVSDVPKNLEKSEDNLCQIFRNCDDIAELQKNYFFWGPLDKNYSVIQAKQSNAIMLMVRNRYPGDEKREYSKNRVLWHKNNIFYIFYKAKLGIDWYFRSKMGYPQRNFCYGF